ncbi:MAG: MopE-related protein [Myxococcota bacterium]|nr:MopE-related protein [Myxococcota bacterium]
MRWTPTLAAADADADGFTNGQELQDPTGIFAPGNAPPGWEGLSTPPGDPALTPGDRDSDGDRHCTFGTDLDGNGDCRGVGEAASGLDCNDADPRISSSETERCDDLTDDDCNGQSTLSDAACVEVVDRDRDGWCLVGRDLDGDRTCVDPGERGLGDCDDARANVYPAAPENCGDGHDNDCNGLVDRDDEACNSVTDHDGDGYCPLGRDLDGDGSCLSEAEQAAGIDCDDTRADVHEGVVERCEGRVDDDCDGAVDLEDDECAEVADRDADGYCPDGIDRDGDGSCLDEGEREVARGDCDDADRDVGPRARERCVGEVDDDCDGAVDLDDDDCAGVRDRDRDGHCPLGIDHDGDGSCVDLGEAAIRGDCDDDDPRAAPGLLEVCDGAEVCRDLCVNGRDEDCDRRVDARDTGCEAFADLDRDGWCEVGLDADGDGVCSATELNALGDAAPADATVFPWASENCLDGRDNDQDGVVDEAEACVATRDLDHDGWCPLGRDLDGDGQCTGPLEDVPFSDCNDLDPSRNPAMPESCFNHRDDDCNGDVDLADTACVQWLDRDGDGFCGAGLDDNGDGDCIDDSEDRFGADCDDTNRDVHPRAVERCDNDRDDDCDGRVDADDASCPCSWPRCADGSCSATCECDADGGACGPTSPVSTPAGCQATHAPTGSLFALVCILLVRRRRRRVDDQRLAAPAR